MDFALTDLIDWSSISKPFALGGWNIKNFEWFNLALRTKSLWLILNGSGLWSHIIKNKYLKNIPMDALLRQHSFKVQGTSHMWNRFIRAMSWITRCLGWKTGDDKLIKIGLDPIAGLSSDYTPPPDLRLYLEDYGIVTLSNALNRGEACTSSDYWISADDLELAGHLKVAWTKYIKGLMHGGIRINNNSDSLAWLYNKTSGSFKANLMYDFIASTMVSDKPEGFLSMI